MSAFFTTSCSAHTVGGKSAKDVFSDPAIRAIATAACKDDKEALSKAISKGDVNAKGLDNVTPLMWALTCRKSEAMKVMLKAGADPNSVANNGSTAVTIAATYGESKFLKLLIENGGDKNAMENGRRDDSALVYALNLGANFDVWENFDYLLAQGADLRTGNKYRKDKNIASTAIGVYGQYCRVMKMIRDGYPVDNLYLYHTAKRRKVPAGELSFCRAELIEHLTAKYSIEDYQQFLESYGRKK